MIARKRWAGGAAWLKKTRWLCLVDFLFCNFLWLILLFYNSCQDSETLQHLSSNFMLPPHTKEWPRVPIPDVELKFLLSVTRKSFFHTANFKLKQDFPPNRFLKSGRIQNSMDLIFVKAILSAHSSVLGSSQLTWIINPDNEAEHNFLTKPHIHKFKKKKQTSRQHHLRRKKKSYSHSCCGCPLRLSIGIPAALCSFCSLPGCFLSSYGGRRTNALIHPATQGPLGKNGGTFTQMAE